MRDELRRAAGEGARPQDGQAAGERPRPAHRRRPAAALPAALRRAGRADRPRRPAGRRARHRGGARSPGRCAGRCATAARHLAGGRRSATAGGSRSICRSSARRPTSPRRELQPGRRGLFAGKVGALRPGRATQLAAHPPRVRAARRRARPDAEEFAAALRADLPGRQGRDALGDPQRALGVGPRHHAAELDDPLPGRRCAPGTGCSAWPRRCSTIHRPRDHGRRAPGARAAQVGRGVRCSRPCSLQRRHGRAPRWPATPRPARAGGLLADFDAALPFELTEGQREVGEEIAADLAAPTPCTGCCRARSARARPSSRCGRCSRWSTPAGRPRCWPPPRCSPSSTTGRSSAMLGRPGRPAACSAAPRSPCSPARWAPRPAARRMLDAASGAAGHRRRHPRAAPGARPVRRPRPGRGRRAAPLRRRAARRAARQGRRRPPHVLVMTATPDPAHGRDDRLRRPRGLHAVASCPRAAPPITTHVVPAAEKPHFLDRAWKRLREEVELRPPGLRRVPAHRRRGGADEGDHVERPPRRRAAAPPLAVLDVAETLAAGAAARPAHRRCCTASSRRRRRTR